MNNTTIDGRTLLTLMRWGQAIEDRARSLDRLRPTKVTVPARAVVTLAIEGPEYVELVAALANVKTVLEHVVFSVPTQVQP